MTEYPQIPPSGIGEAAKYNFSPWFIHERFSDESLTSNRYWNDATKPLSVAQATVGNQFEQQVYDYIESNVRGHINEWYDWGDEQNQEQLIEEIRDCAESEYNKPLMMTQVRLSGEIGCFDILGDSDLIILFCTDSGVRIHITDIKSSWEEKPSQQIQTATYTRLIRDLLDDAVDFSYEITAGIIYRETDLDSVTDPDSTPQFDEKTREGDVERVLKENGPFKFALDRSFDDLPVSYNEMSPTAEATTARLLETGDPLLLGISQGEKSELEYYGINNIYDIAKLYEPMNDPKPYEYDEPERNSEYSDVVDDLKQNKAIDTEISDMSYRAQSMLGELSPDHQFAHDKPWIPWLNGSGDGQLPEDDPPYDADLPFREGSMIRVYLDIQHDHIRDEIVSVSGAVSCTRHSGDPLTFSVCTDDITLESSEWREENERRLLEEAISEIYNTVKFLSDFANLGDSVPIHFYVYDQNSYENLYDAVIRHKESDIVSSFRSIMDMRNGIEQQMFSIVEDEIRNRFAKKDVDTSIQSIINRMYPNDDSQKVTDDDWTILDNNGNTVNLKEAFDQYIFDNYLPIRHQSDTHTFEVMNESGQKGDNDGYYSVSPRSGSQIPIEYLWASEDINILDENWADSGKQESIIRNFMWANGDETDVRLATEHFESMTRLFARCLLHIERAITYRNNNIEKRSIPIQKISENIGTDDNLASACFDYLDLESRQEKSDATDVYSKPLKKRITDGDSIPVEITGVRTEKSYMFEVEGRMVLDDMNIDNPQEVAESSRIKSTGGTRCVATPLIKSLSEGYEVAVDTPNQVSSSVKVSVKEYDPEDQSIVLTGYRQGRGPKRYVEARPPWTLDIGSDKQYVGAGQAFVLDPAPDNIMAEKSIKALDSATRNPVYKDIERPRYGRTDVQSSMFSSRNCSEYIDWIGDQLEFIPNEEQQSYITEISKYSLLQGPPGTGKTSGAVAHSVLARAYDRSENDEELTGLVTGLSNKSVDEVMSEVAKLKEIADESFESHPLEKLRLVRLSYTEPADGIDNVDYLSHREHIDELQRLLSPQSDSKQKTFDTVQQDEHVIVFTTPGKLEGMVDQLMSEADEEENAYQNPNQLFDLLVVDEASMMPMYQLILTSAFMSDGYQVLIGGDHRQLPPVQKYEWSDERRWSIRSHLPHLSVLDYFRYLRGDSIDGTYDETPPSPEVDIPLIQLEETYRCHQQLTKFLRDVVYSQDDLDYRSERHSLIDSNNITDEEMHDIIGSDYPITLIIHDDRSSQQVNEVENRIISSIMQSVEGYSRGVVTPHNAQKGRLSVSCPDSTVDTVERFQGGEKDIMAVSATVSDPDFLTKEEEFILSENRLNVALSRMKKKLIIVASRSIFELVPKDTDVYSDAKIWKSLYAVADATESPDVSKSVSDISEYPIGGSFDVYHIDEV